MREIQPNSNEKKSSSKKQTTEKKLQPSERIVRLQVSSESQQTTEPYSNDNQFDTTKNTNEKNTTFNTVKKCMWDCNEFDWQPFGIPLLKGDTCTGIYCSFECAVASLFNTNTTYHDKWHIYYRINKEADKYNQAPIRSAPPRELLQDFGGNMTIDEFRNKYTQSSNNVQHVFHYPMIHVNKDVENVNCINEKRNPKLFQKETRNQISESDKHIREKYMG